MPRKRSSDSSNSGKTGAPVSQRNVPWGGFVEIRLNEADKQAFEDWCAANPQGYWLDLGEALAQGIKFGLSYDGDGDFYIASFTASGADTIGLQDRWCLTARSPHMEQAIALVCFKHFNMAEGDWGKYKTNGLKGERFG